MTPRPDGQASHLARARRASLIGRRLRLSIRPSMSSLAGKFIVFEGGEGSGKSTQAKILHHRLESAGYSVLSVRDPGTTKIGEMVRGILLNPDNAEMSMRCE